MSRRPAGHCNTVPREDFDMNGLRKLLFVVLPCAMLVAAPVSADPPHGRGKGPPAAKHHWKKGGGEHHARGFSGGPPPWAPAHGYRRKQGEEYVSVPVNIQTGSCNRELIGQILGGATGGLVGSQIGDGTGRLIAVAAGTVVGAVIGGEIGRSMDKTDRLCVDQALEHAPDGSRIRWNDDGRQYTVTPQGTRQNDEGQYCREYQMETEIGGRTQQAHGRACRQPDGAWKIVS
jgi:surface antigen